MSLEQGDCRVAVVGTGAMGSVIARTLLKKGMQVDVWNRTPASAAALGEQGASVHADVAKAVHKAHVVITMLSTAEATAAVALGGGMLAALQPGAVWVQMGTIGVEGTDKLNQAAQGRSDIDFVDAPVSGTWRAMAAGQMLLVLASGPDRAVAKVEPVFATLGRRTMWLGTAGRGMRVKLLLNTWMAFLYEGMAETSALANRLGVDLKELFSALDDGPLAAMSAMFKLRRMMMGDFVNAPDCILEWLLKDVDLALSAGGSGLPVAESIASRWHELVDRGFGPLDGSATRFGLLPVPAQEESFKSQPVAGGTRHA